MQAAPKKRILIADDDPFYRDMSREALADAAFRVEEATDGADALRKLEASRFDIAMIDLTMPGIDGFEVIRRVRREGINQQTPLIVITGHDDAASVGKAYEIGATSFLAKPLNWALFVNHVEFVLRASRTEIELRETTHAIEFLSRLKTNLLSVLAHEGRAPLNVVYGFTELMRQEVQGPLGAPIYQEYVTDIAKSVEQLNLLVVKMLHFGRALSEGIALEEESVALKPLIEDVLASSDPKAEQRAIKIASLIAIGDDVMVSCDRSLLSQCLKSLVETAVRFSPRSSRIMVAAAIDGEGNLSFSVEDQSPPMAQMQIQAILNPSGKSLTYNSQPAIARDVGLTITKILAESHQGKLTMTSTANAGMSTRLVVPRTRLSRVIAGTAVPLTGADATPVAANQATSRAKPEVPALAMGAAPDIWAGRATVPVLKPPLSGGAPKPPVHKTGS